MNYFLTYFQFRCSIQVLYMNRDIDNNDHHHDSKLVFNFLSFLIPNSNKFIPFNMKSKLNRKREKEKEEHQTHIENDCGWGKWEVY